MFREGEVEIQKMRNNQRLIRLPSGKTIKCQQTEILSDSRQNALSENFGQNRDTQVYSTNINLKDLKKYKAQDRA